MRRFLLILAFILWLSPLVRAQDNRADLEKEFAGANTLLEQKKYPEALAEYRKILAAQPDLEGPLQNGAMAAYFAGDYKTAQEYYEKLKADKPTDGFVRAKLVQVFQAMGDGKARDTERADLIALHNAGKDTSSLAKRPDFCREQYHLGTRQVFVYEPFVFHPRAGNLFAVRYQFIILDASEKPEVRIEAGWDGAQKDDKGEYQPDKATGFYFDAYYPAAPTVHHTKGVFTGELSYDACKAHVKSIVEGKAGSPDAAPHPASIPKL